MKSKLQELFQKYNISGISCNSKDVKETDVFFAMKGHSKDGNEFIRDALIKGARLIITDTPSSAVLPNIVHIADVRRALAEAAIILYPDAPSNLIGVTGTNGKTSVVSYCMQLLSLLSKKSACLGTIGLTSCDPKIQNAFRDSKYSSLTTAPAELFRDILNQLAQYKCEYLAFEASSHGLEQNRLYSIPVQAAAFTSFSRDHLDYHGTMEEYLEAKLKLFEENLISGGLAVINSEIIEIAKIKNILSQKAAKCITVGKRGDASIDKINANLFGQEITFSYMGTKYQFYTNIIGSFQATNLLMALFLVSAYGFDIPELVQLLPKLQAVRGRLERITTPTDAKHIFVDYAHTPDALHKSLFELKQIKPQSGRLFVVFGCGGNRDSGKRPQMGKIATELADVVIVTDDNPRFEQPELIRRDILKTAPSAIEVDDRRDAIECAISSMKADDVLLIAGKGHEEYQSIRGQDSPFNDAEIARKTLADI